MFPDNMFRVYTETLTPAIAIFEMADDVVLLKDVDVVAEDDVVSEDDVVVVEKTPKKTTWGDDPHEKAEEAGGW